MAVAVESSGTQSATISTEHTLGTSPTTAKTRQLCVDLNAMATGDVVELRIKRKTLTGGTVRTMLLATFAHAQAEPIVTSIPVALPFGGDFTLLQTAGTGRSFPWSIETLD
jgi:hypothetical protein